MIFVRAKNKTVQVEFLGDPFGVAVAENDIAAGSAVIVAGIGIIVILAGEIAGIPIIGIINDPNIGWTHGLPGTGVGLL